MKTLFKTYAFLFISIITFSCSKDDETPAPATPLPTANTNFIRATIDGVAYEATGSQITTISDVSAFNINSDATGTGFAFSIMGAPSVRLYSFNSSNLSTVGLLRYLSPDMYLTSKCSGSGTLTITAKNGNTIEGTFSFTGFKLVGLCSEPTKTITNGTFRATL